MSHSHPRENDPVGAALFLAPGNALFSLSPCFISHACEKAMSSPRVPPGRSDDERFRTSRSRVACTCFDVQPASNQTWPGIPRRGGCRWFR